MMLMSTRERDQAALLRDQAHVRFLRMRLNFVRKYGDGAYTLLMQMAADDKRLDDMADEFGLTRQRINQLLTEFLGMPYSHYRKQRRKERNAQG